MKSRPYKYYNTSQILGLIQSNPDNLVVAMNVAYEIACRRRISKEKRVGVITKLEEITVNAIDSKDNEIQELKRRLNNKEQRIKELEDTEKIISGSIKNLKDEILQSIHQEVGGLKLTLSDTSTHQKNTINELKNKITIVDQNVAAIKETIEAKADKKGIRIPEDSDDSQTESSPSDEDTATGERITTPSKPITESDIEGGRIKNGEDVIPSEYDDITENGRSTIESHNNESEINGATITEDEDPSNPDEGNIAPDDPTNDSHCLFDELVAKKRLSVHNNTLKIEGEFSQEDHRNLVLNLTFNITDKINSKEACLYFYYWWLSNRNEENITSIFILDSLNRDIQSVLDNNPVIEIKPKFRLSSTEFLQLALGGMQEMGAVWSVHPEIKSLGALPGVVFTDEEVKSKLSSHLSLLLKNVPETFEGFMLQLMIRDRFPNGVDFGSSSEHLHHLVKLIAVNAQSHEITDPQVDDPGDSPTSTVNLDIDDIEDETPDPIPADIEEPRLEGTPPGMPIASFEIKHQEPTTDKRTNRPRNYWVLRINENDIQIYLELGLREIYTPKSLSTILSIDAIEKEYQLYLNEQLICVFRKMINGNYLTEWHLQDNLKWNGESTIPKAYVTNKENKYEVSDFINSYPTLKEPSLWHKRSDIEWQLAKGNNISAKKGAVLHPEKWQVNGVGHTSTYEVHGIKMQWTLFEGKVDIQSTNGVSKTYQSNVASFNWIILDQSPKWMIKSDMVVVQSTPKIVVYTSDEEVNITDEAQIWIKSRYNSDTWDEYYENMPIQEGVLELKIEKDGITVYDTFFNIGKLRIDNRTVSSTQAVLEIWNTKFDTFNIINSPEYSITQLHNRYHINLNPNVDSIPKSVQCRIGNHNQRKLSFHLSSPVSGLCIVDASGNLLHPGKRITYATMEGFRILSRKDLSNIVSFKNTLRSDVVISKELKHESTPLISFKDEIYRLLYLTDIMNYQNSVTLELSDETEENTISYTISGFTHTLNIESVSNNILRVEGPDHELNLFAIPLNCTPHKIKALPIPGNDIEFFIPACNFTDDFVIISGNQDGYQLMPRFVTLDANYTPVDRQDRIDEYHRRLSNNFYSNSIWRETQAYFDICIKFDIPFSTFDQITAISRSSETAAKAFLFFAIFQEDKNTYIQKIIPDLEEDLGISFHWIRKSDWSRAIDDVSLYCERIYQNSHLNFFVDVLSIYLNFNGLAKLSTFLSSQNPIEADAINHQDIMKLRGRLGERVLGELPSNKPIIENTYGIPFNTHHIVALLLHAPIAVAESIAEIQNDTPIWGGEEIRDKIRRNIQYCQYLDPEFYYRVILHVLHHINQE